MIYRKNIYQWEQALRLLAGAAMLAYGVWAIPGTTWSYGLIAVGLVTAATGAFGYCPACAMVGRRLKTE